MAAAAKVFALDHDLDAFVETLRLLVTQAVESLAEADQYGMMASYEDEDLGDEVALAAEEAKDVSDQRELDDDYFLVQNHHARQQ